MDNVAMAVLLDVVHQAERRFSTLPDGKARIGHALVEAARLLSKKPAITDFVPELAIQSALQHLPAR